MSIPYLHVMVLARQPLRDYSDVGLISLALRLTKVLELMVPSQKVSGYCQSLINVSLATVVILDYIVEDIGMTATKKPHYACALIVFTGSNSLELLTDPILVDNGRGTVYARHHCMQIYTL